MAEKHSYEIHPDADRLAAFAERNLTSSERAEMVQHLAGCSRCRQVLFLAHEATLQEAAPVERSASPLRQMKNWVRLGLPLAAAAVGLAAVVGVSLLWYQRLHSVLGPYPAGQSAAVVAQPAPPVSARGSAAQNVPAAPAHRTLKAAAREPSGANSAMPAPELLKPRLPGVPKFSPQPLMSAMSAPPANVQTSRQAWPSSSAEGLQSERLQRKQQSQMETESELQTARYGAAGEHASKAQLAAAMPSFQRKNPEPGAAPPAGATKGSVSGGFENTMPLENGRAWSGTKMSAAGGAVPAPPPTLLPGGQPVKESVRQGNRRVALDASGALYLSTDKGAHWRRITQQWTGKATGLMLLPADKAIQPATDSLLLLNDANAAWISADGGEHWQPFIPRQ